jgi:class 3 adenylate cyclase
MARLNDNTRNEIIRLIEAGNPLPDSYQRLLFPHLESGIWALAESTYDPSETEEPMLLVVDDNPDNRELLTDMLDFHNYRTQVARHGKEAVEMIEAGNYDLVLLDIMMPQMNGYEVLEYLRDRGILPHLPVIVISALDQMESIVRCIELGAEDHLPKPFNPTLLRARINASLEKKRLHDKEVRLLQQLQIEQEKSERLLLNVLPATIAQRLKQIDRNGTIADNFNDVTVIFADIVDFTRFSTQHSPAEIVSLLNEIFSTFDDLAESHTLEKIKTIGDSYMAVGGLPTPREDHAESVVRMALDMQREIKKFRAGDDESIQLRIGISTGPVVAGVIGTKKFIYDLWGDTVNMASRMEALGIPGEIQVTDVTYERLKEKYQFEPRGSIDVKGKGEMQTYLLLGA